ncbi:MAG TPA: hypothetical protein VJ733_02510 [Candidatus Binatia bacterium]|nr:hypothetical protein [Candidatus Binatia bacterium]
MTRSRKADIAPLFEAFGAAVFEAQNLEHGLSLLLSVIDAEFKKTGRVRSRVNLDTPSAPKTVGKLFEEVKLVEYLTEPERKIIARAIRDRNYLVHSYWNGDRITAMMNQKGRNWLVKDLDHLRETCRKADRLVGKLIDRYLKKYGTSLDALSTPLWGKWESGESVPPELLH